MQEFTREDGDEIRATPVTVVVAWLALPELQPVAANALSVMPQSRLVPFKKPDE